MEIQEFIMLRIEQCQYMMSLLEADLMGKFPIDNAGDRLLLMERNEYAGKINALNVALSLLRDDSFQKTIVEYGEHRLLSAEPPSMYETAIYETCEELGILDELP